MVTIESALNVSELVALTATALTLSVATLYCGYANVKAGSPSKVKFRLFTEFPPDCVLINSYRSSWL